MTSSQRPIAQFCADVTGQLIPVGFTHPLRRFSAGLTNRQFDKDSISLLNDLTALSIALLAQKMHNGFAVERRLGNCCGSRARLLQFFPAMVNS
jgi:hypothetical protein